MRDLEQIDKSIESIVDTPNHHDDELSLAKMLHKMGENVGYQFTFLFDYLYGQFINFHPNNEAIDFLLSVHDVDTFKNKLKRVIETGIPDEDDETMYIMKNIKKCKKLITYLLSKGIKLNDITYRFEGCCFDHQSTYKDFFNYLIDNEITFIIEVYSKLKSTYEKHVKFVRSNSIYRALPIMSKRRYKCNVLIYNMQKSIVKSQYCIPLVKCCNHYHA